MTYEPQTRTARGVIALLDELLATAAADPAPAGRMATAFGQAMYRRVMRPELARLLDADPDGVAGAVLEHAAPLLDALGVRCQLCGVLALGTATIYGVPERQEAADGA